MKNSGFLFIAIILLIVGLAGLITLPYLFSYFRASKISESYSSLGEQIYFSGYGENARIVPYEKGPGWLRMHGGGCASCHGDDGKGGFQIMMSDEEPPPITWAVLTEEEYNGHEDEEGHPPYHERTIMRAITDGLNPSGEKLDSIMPRWEMNQRELNAIIDFLKKLD